MSGGASEQKKLNLNMTIWAWKCLYVRSCAVHKIISPDPAAACVQGYGGMLEVGLVWPGMSLASVASQDHGQSQALEAGWPQFRTALKQTWTEHRF